MTLTRHFIRVAAPARNRVAEFENPVAGKAVLFIGNSPTYYNDLPVLVQGIADAPRVTR